MILPHLSFILSQVILALLLLTGEHTRCDQPPTVFVLDTSDSDSSVASVNGEASSLKSAQDETSKTEIITDEGPTKLGSKQTSQQDSGTAAKSAGQEPSETQQSSHQRYNQQQVRNNSASGGDEHHQTSKSGEHKHLPSAHHDASKEKHRHGNQTAHDAHEGAQNEDAAAAAKHRDNAASRRSLDSESHLAARDKPAHGGPAGGHAHHEPPHAQPRPPAHHDHHPPPPPHQHNHPPNGEHHGPAHHKPDQPTHAADHQPAATHNQKPKTTSTTVGPEPEQDQAPKTEERLLISIISDEDDNYQRPSKPAAGSSSGYNDEPSAHQQQPHHHQKRKPGFTISIQDPGIVNKQNQGHPAVILRPTEDGIVIATLGSGAGGIGGIGNNKKPGGGGILSGILGAVSDSINQSGGGGHINHNHHQNNNNNNNNDPYREPANTPAQRPQSTTRSPLINEPFQGNSNNQPVVSTLVGGQRPQQPWTDERPQKPTFDETALSSETTRRPTSRPAYQDASPPPSGQLQEYENNGGAADSQPGPKYPLNERNCGIMHETRIVGGEEADPDDFMWMAAIIKSKPRDGEPRPFCGGSLITRRHILTAAHCLEGLAPRDVLVRLGGYDFEDTASSSSADFAIDQFRVPAQYSKKTHVADIAIMRLKTPLQLTDTYRTVCMPQPRRSYVGALGTVTGYGSQSQTFRRAAPKLRQVTVPIWENRKCSTVYKKNLTESFMCAGYEEGGKDACQGDSGGPLMTEGPEQKMMIVGVVSHGIGCGAPGYPGVYTRTSTFTDWIEKNTRE